MLEKKKERYFVDNDSAEAGDAPKKLKYCVGGQWLESKTDNYMDCFNPSTGEVIALAPQCTADEVEMAVTAAKEAYPAWADTPVSKRVQVLYKMKHLLDAHLEELTYLLAMENGKKWAEAMGDVLKVTEVVEFACGAPQLMKGESLMKNVRRSTRLSTAARSLATLPVPTVVSISGV